MSLAVCLFLYGFAVTTLAPRLLAQLTRGGIAPGFGLVAWVSAICSVAGSWAAAVIILAVDVVRDWAEPSRPVWSSCYSQLHDAATGSYGGVVQGGLIALAAFVTLAAAVLLLRVIRSLVRARSSTHEHARMARVAGRHDSGLDAVVLDLSEPAAYCVAGKPHTVVITRGALSALDDRHLAAVLAHERAHLAGRHHLLLALTRGLAATFSRIELFTLGAAEVARLVEMRADDVAAREHGHRTVLQALLALSGVADSPTGSLSATAVGLATRVERLTAPCETALRTRARRLLIAATTLVTLGPLITVLLAAIGIAICAPITA
ncbi:MULTISPECIES: M56 family metallopeptidase [Nocardia]|uniref:M56 family metallopeptidase n=1 Tax=Nocardia TaxID=1817 RepID=UPI0002F20BF2|nr:MULTISPECIES: M56 family metallopeptidase [Nocardia]